MGARVASLTIMVGGPAPRRWAGHARTRARDQNITLVGEADGAGQTCKIANQIIVALNIGAVAEALVFAGKAGCDPARLWRRS